MNLMKGLAFPLVNIIPIQNYDQKLNGLIKIDLNQIPFPNDFLNRKQDLIYIPPLKIGGNHVHPRREIFLCLNDDVELHWVDKNGNKQIHGMKDKNRIYLFDVHPFTPHAIINLSQDKPAIILEFSNSDQQDVEIFRVIDVN